MFPNLLLKRAHLSPDRIALRFEEKEWTFQQLYNEANEFAEKLHSKKILPGMRIAILSRYHAELVIAIHGFLQLGCELVMLNERLSEVELNYQLNDSKPDFLLVDNDERRISYSQRSSFNDIHNRERKVFSLERNWPKERTISIMYTSGTTGRPKGVRQSLENHVMNATGSALHLGIHPKDCWLCVVPLFHISGFSILMRSVLYGMTVSLHTRFEPETVVDEIIAGAATRMSLVGVMLQRVVSILESRNQYFPDTFQTILVGGGPVPLSYLERAIERNIPVQQTYGMTETASQTTTLSSEDAIRKLGSSGKPLFFADVRIEGEEKLGEICIRGPHVTNGYIGAAEAKKPLIDGWLYTGDIGYLDEEGYLFVVDRRSDLIISGGENIYPAELEQALVKHPAVVEAGVTGRQDDKWGQVPVAFVVVNELVTIEELSAFMKTQIASYKLPKEYHFIEELPRNGANKLVRRELLNLL